MFEFEKPAVFAAGCRRKYLRSISGARAEGGVGFAAEGEGAGIGQQDDQEEEVSQADYASDFLFKTGDKVVLHGLIEHPEYNGIVLTIFTYGRVPRTSYCPSGRVYYFKAKLPFDVHYIYEERLKLLTN